MSDISIETLIVELARSLHASGAPAYELDQRMEDVSASMGRPAKFYSTPTALFVTFDLDPTSTRLVRVYPGDTNLGRYGALYELQRAIQEQNLSATEAWDRLKDIESRPEQYPAIIHIAAYGIVASCVAVLVGGNSTVVLGAGPIGLIVGMIVMGLSRFNYPVHLINVIAGFVASCIGCLIHLFVDACQFELVALCALVVLLPGLTLTISINELATQNLASGTARIAGAMTTLLTLVFGVYMGFGLINAFVPVPPSMPRLVPAMVPSLASTIPIGICFAVLFRARYQNIIWVTVSVVFAYTTLRLAAEVFNPLAAVWVAAVVSGIASRYLSRWRRLPAALLLMPALLLLVPGSLGFAGLSRIMLSEDLPTGIRLVATMLMTAGSIVAGLLLSDVIAPLRSVKKDVLD